MVDLWKVDASVIGKEEIYAVENYFIFSVRTMYRRWVLNLYDLLDQNDIEFIDIKFYSLSTWLVLNYCKKNAWKIPKATKPLLLKWIMMQWHDVFIIHTNLISIDVN